MYISYLSQQAVYFGYSSQQAQVFPVSWLVTMRRFGSQVELAGLGGVGSVSFRRGTAHSLTQQRRTEAFCNSRLALIALHWVYSKGVHWHWMNGSRGICMYVPFSLYSRQNVAAVWATSHTQFFRAILARIPHSWHLNHHIETSSVTSTKQQLPLINIHTSSLVGQEALHMTWSHLVLLQLSPLLCQGLPDCRIQCVHLSLAHQIRVRVGFEIRVAMDNGVPRHRTAIQSKGKQVWSQSLANLDQQWGQFINGVFVDEILTLCMRRWQCPLCYLRLCVLCTYLLHHLWCLIDVAIWFHIDLSPQGELVHVILNLLSVLLIYVQYHCLEGISSPYIEQRVFLSTLSKWSSAAWSKCDWAEILASSRCTVSLTS